MEKNNRDNSYLQFETGATHAAVNELILYTDNTPELVAIRNSIYMVMQAVPEVSLRPLLSRAIETYGKEFGRNADTRHIRLMDQNERDEYCQIYANRFADWKKEKELQIIQSKSKKQTFQTPYQQYKQHEGKAFDILREHPDKEDEADRGKLYEIRLETGEEITAWPEEIFNDI